MSVTNSVGPDEIPHNAVISMRDFIWVFFFCKSTHLGVSHIQRVIDLIFKTFYEHCNRNYRKAAIRDMF